MSLPRKKSLIILNLLKEGSITTAEILLNAALVPLMVPYKGVRPLISGPISLKRQEKQRIYTMLSRLQRDGLVSANETKGKKRWFLTKQGKQVIYRGGFNKNEYQKRVSKEVVVVSYDIPEKKRTDRDWLRSCLRLLDFELVHQSVWIGKVSLPEEFLFDMRERGLANFVHIFSIGKEGTLRKTL